MLLIRSSKYLKPNDQKQYNEIKYNDIELHNSTYNKRPEKIQQNNIKCGKFN